MGVLKQYLVFAYDRYYPGGGWSDFKGSFDTEEEAVRYLHATGGQFWEIVDILDPSILDPSEDVIIRTPWVNDNPFLGWRDDA